MIKGRTYPEVQWQMADILGELFGVFVSPEDLWRTPNNKWTDHHAWEGQIQEGEFVGEKVAQVYSWEPMSKLVRSKKFVRMEREELNYVQIYLDKSSPPGEGQGEQGE
jgi:hypothetical protein